MFSCTATESRHKNNTEVELSRGEGEKGKESLLDCVICIFIEESIPIPDTYFVFTQCLLCGRPVISTLHEFFL